MKKALYILIIAIIAIVVWILVEQKNSVPAVDQNSVDENTSAQDIGSIDSNQPNL